MFHYSVHSELDQTEMFRTIYDEKHKQWLGVKKRPIYNPAITLGEALLKTMQVHGPKIAQVRCISTQFTYF